MIGEKIQYAPNRNGKLISINEAKRGLACNCICPACKSVLIARKGDVRIPHFAHYKNNSCATGYQTSLHLLAKELINEKKMIIIPPVYCDLFHEDENENEGYFFRSEVIKDKQLLTNVDVYLETKENGIIPDIIIQYGDYKLYVEIYVTHQVDGEKKQLVKEKGISMMEIDLSKENRLISKEELSKYLFENTSNSYWINNKILNKRNELEQKKKIDFIKERELEKQEKEQEEKIEREKLLAERKKEQEDKIKNGICPSCGFPFVKVWDKQSQNFFIACIKPCYFWSYLSEEYKNIIQNLLKNESIIIKQNWALQYGKCPRCWSNLKIFNGPHGPFIGCSKFPQCKAEITIDKEAKLYLPDELVNSYNEKIRLFKITSSKNMKKNNSSGNRNSEHSQNSGFDMSIDEFLENYGSDE